MSTRVNSLAGPGKGAIGGPFAALAQNLAIRARALWDGYWDLQARRATALILEALDERMLKDIGLTRSEIWPAALGHDPARPRPYDPHWRKPS